MPRAFTHCPTCKFEYETQAIIINGDLDRLWKFRCLVVRDTSLFFAAIQTVLALVGVALHQLDPAGRILHLYPHDWAERKALAHMSIGPYYVSSVVLCLATLGVVSLGLKVAGRLPDGPPRREARAIRDWQPTTRNAPSSSCYCGPAACDFRGDVCCCCEGSVPPCEPCDCGAISCEGEGALGGLMMVALLMLATLAIVGLIAAVFSSTLVLQRIFQRHLHLLRRRSEAQELLVIDLSQWPVHANASATGYASTRL